MSLLVLTQPGNPVNTYGPYTYAVRPLPAGAAVRAHRVAVQLTRS